MDKKCIACGETKPLEEYYKDKKMLDGYRSNCKICHRETERVRGLARYDSSVIVPTVARQTLSLEDKKRNKANYRYQRTYGITLAEYEDMVRVQGGLCAICDNPSDKLFVDHCHKTNAVRALLCLKCNMGLGFFEDKEDILETAILYLKNIICNYFG